MDDHGHAHVTRLAGGRRLSYRSIGPRDGALVIYLHGAIGSPQLASPELLAVTRELGLRYVMVDRPGFGGSDDAPGRTLLAFARDVAALADHLGRARFAVVGVSAGGPYALACAHELPARVVVSAVVSSIAPGGCPADGLPLTARLGLRLLRAHPRTCALVADALTRSACRHPRLVARLLRAAATPADRRLLAASASDAGGGPADRFLAVARGGVAGMIEDHLICSRPWGFRPEDVGALVQLWHGVDDPIAPVEHAVALAASLPRVTSALHAGEGHFFYRRHLREILGGVASVLASDAVLAAPFDGPPLADGRRIGAGVRL